jgi:GNAT superfamily N-acetyltransferase
MIRKTATYIQRAALADLTTARTTVGPATKLRWIEQDEQHLIVDCPYRPEKKSGPEFFERHYVDGGRICAAIVDGDLVAWRLFKPQFQRMWDWLEVRGDDSVVFGLAAYTAPHARGKRLMAAVTTHAAREYVKLGYATLLATTNRDNAAAVSAHSHIGMQKIGLIEATRWPLGLRTVRVNGELTAGFFNHRRRLVHHAS